ncbi:MAG: cell envelope integrity protein TolA [Bacteroidales bacterium]
MQPLQNNDPRRIPSERGKGLAGTAVIHMVVFLVLFLVGFSAPKQPVMEEGILVNFGTDETGLGLIEPSPAPAVQETTPVATDNTPVKPSNEDAVVTQNFDKEAPEIKKVDPEAEKKKKEQIEAEKKRLADLEAERIRKAREDAEKKKAEEDQRRANDIVNRTKNAMSNARNSGTNSTSEGIAGGAGNQGVPTGSVDSKNRGNGSGTGNNGVSFDLAGRSFQALPNPSYDYQGEGVVVVEIFVDRTGKVVQANPGVKGTTILDDYLVNVAREAALKAKFDAKPDAPPTQKGTITYNFKLK